MSATTEQSADLRVAPPTELPAQLVPVAIEPRASRKAKWALASGVTGMFVLALLFSTVAIALGVVAKNEIDRDPELEGRGKAVAAIVLGVIGLVVFAVWMTAQVATS